jgi:Predicted membrane protein (DUF2142)
VNKSRAADITAILVILLAGGLSSAWAFIVPIFQATDEAAHFDYAMSIFDAGHLVSVRDRQATWIVTPATRYLLGATDYFRIAFHSSMRVRPGYGSLAYYRNLDSHGPSLANPRDDTGKISYIAPSYPFAFYAIVAVCIKAVSLFTSSLIAGFFAARLLCVFFMMAGLYFIYRASRNIGIPPWLAIALIVTTGFFPLTTMVSSYVQPDNLAFVLVAASLFFATTLHSQRGNPLPAMAALGLCLGLLAVTKYHFFLSVAIPIALLIGSEFWLKRVAAGTAIVRGLIIGAPALILLSLQFTIVSGVGFAPTTSAHPEAVGQAAVVASRLIEVSQAGAIQAILFLFRNAAKAFVEFFVTGPNMATYWGAVGLWDVPIIVVNESIELFLRIVFALGSVVTVTLVAYRIAHNSARLTRLAQRGRPRQALWLAFKDPIIATYAFMVTMMFVLYVVTDNAMGLVGRHWYPYVFAGFLCAAWYAPRSLPSTRKKAPIVIAATLAAYSVIASAYATAAVIHRYYGKNGGAFKTSLPVASELTTAPAVGALWSIQGMDFHPLFARRYRYAFPLRSRLWAGGAAILPDAHRAAENIAVVVDGHRPVPTLAGLYSFQIAEATRGLTYAYSGFFAPFNTFGLTEGAHVVTAYAELPNRQQYAPILPARTFFLMPGTEFSPSFSQHLKRARNANGSLSPLLSCESAPSQTNGIPTIRMGGALLAQGRFGSRLPSHSTSVVWLLVDGKPYPAAFKSDGRSFYGAIPSSDLAVGRHEISAYLTRPRDSANLRIAGSRQFIVSSDRRDRRLRWAPQAIPALCVDATRILNGS